MTFKLQSRRCGKKLGLEALERRDLMAVGELLLHITSPNPNAVCGPSPFESAEVAVPDEVISPALGPAGAAEDTTSETNSYSHMTAELVDRVLIIRGDAGRNAFSITSRLVTGVVNIRPYSTKINGQVVEYQLTFQNITRIDIDLGAGDDLVVVDDDRVVGMTINTGAGNDEITLRGPVPSSFAVGFYTHVATEPAKPLIVDGDLIIDTGDGDDKLTPYATVMGNATVRMGAGDDSFFEIPHEYPNNHITIYPDSTGPYLHPATRRVLGELKATGTLSVDLGSGQDVENIPDDYRSDPELVRILGDVPEKLDLYQEMVERGEATPGTPQLVVPAFPELAGRADAEGRLEIEFGFTPGFRRAADRLVARGVIVDAFSVVRGLGRASIREEDLKLFANLPGLNYLRTRTYLRPDSEPGIVLNYHWDPEWDFVRAGSATAAEIAAEEGPQPVVGPPRLEDVPVRAPGDFGTLLESFYGPRFMGPQPLQ